MFIRSQDKRKLIPAEKYVICVANAQEKSGIHHRITATAMEYIVLGEYSTEERAIEVLSWIMEAIENEENTYQMPQELEPVFTGAEEEMNGGRRWRD